MCTDADAITLMRALVARATGLPPTAPAVQSTADLLLRLAPVLARLPPDWTGTLQLSFRHGGIGRIEKLVPLSDGLDSAP